MGMKRIVLSIVWMLGIAVILMLALFIVRNRGKDETAVELTPVRTERPVQGIMDESLHYPGTLMPEKTIEFTVCPDDPALVVKHDDGFRGVVE